MKSRCKKRKFVYKKNQIEKSQNKIFNRVEI